MGFLDLRNKVLSHLARLKKLTNEQRMSLGGKISKVHIPQKSFHCLRITF